MSSIEFVDANDVQLADKSKNPPVPECVTSLAIGQSVNLVATVINDNPQLGVNWTVNCGSLPPGGGTNGVISDVCGSFTPAETVSGPVPIYPVPSGISYVAAYQAPSVIPKGSNVTITAHAASLPSVTSSWTMTVTDASQATVVGDCAAGG